MLEFLIQGALQEMRGFLPTQLKGVRTGFECYHDNAFEVMKRYRDVNFGDQWQRALAIRIVGDFNELVAAWMAAVAYARASDGIVFDPQEGKVFSLQQARGVLLAIERDRPAFDEALRKIETALRIAARTDR